jgi:hypothetical protein
MVLGSGASPGLALVVIDERFHLQPGIIMFSFLELAGWSLTW